MERSTARRTRDDWLLSDDAALLRDCRVDTYRASGPGGQKRNKTSSAVRLRHGPSGLMAIAEESRSQHENKARALRRLRMMIALQIRSEMDGALAAEALQPYLSRAGGIELSARNTRYPALAAMILDVFFARGGRISEAANDLGIRTSQLSRFITADSKLMAAANQIRAAQGLKPLRVTDE